jgi:hypothetical protein
MGTHRVAAFPEAQWHPFSFSMLQSIVKRAHILALLPRDFKALKRLNSGASSGEGKVQIQPPAECATRKIQEASR